MADEETKFSPCSQMDLRTAATKAAYEKAKEMEAQGKPGASKYQAFRIEETERFLAFGKQMQDKGMCEPMAWSELKAAVDEFSAAK